MPPSPILVVTEYGPRVVPGLRGIDQSDSAFADLGGDLIGDEDLPELHQSSKSACQFLTTVIARGAAP